MRAGTGWVAAAAIAAAACGQGQTVTTHAEMVDEHDGPDAVCELCKVTGGGQVMIGEQTIQFAVQAIPESGPAAGPGFGGVGVAAKGSVRVHPVPAGGTPPVVGDVDTILSCTRENGTLTATFSGTYAGGRFTGTVIDRGEPSVADVIGTAGSLVFGPLTVANGNVQVHDLDVCRQPCPEGTCWCEPEKRCEPCGADDHDKDPPPVKPPPLQP